MCAGAIPDSDEMSPHQAPAVFHNRSAMPVEPRVDIVRNALDGESESSLYKSLLSTSLRGSTIRIGIECQAGLRRWLGMFD